MKELFLLRGLPGSGKSTLANSIGGTWVEADMYFLNSAGEYNFNPMVLMEAHKWCKDRVEKEMKWYSELDPVLESDSRIVVSNTFTQEWEMQAYVDLAKKYGYRVTTLIVENRHGNSNIHGVPDDKLDIMRNRFEIKL